MPNKITVKETIELFVSRTLDYIKNEYETAKFNIIFNDARDFFTNNEYKLNLKEDELKDILEPIIDEESPTLIVYDSTYFFELLTKIINAQIALNNFYGELDPIHGVANRVMRRLWLRLESEDFNNVEAFLEKELAFLESYEFDAPKEEKAFKAENNTRTTYEVEECETWCESTRRICFRVYLGDEYHDLPKIYYDIIEENGEKVCYIKAVQTGPKPHRIKKLERAFYSLAKDIPDLKVHPNFLMAMSFFYELLLSRNITHLKVPLLQVLSYHYHIVLGSEVKEKMLTKWTPEKLKLIEEIKAYSKEIQETFAPILEEYEFDRGYFNHMVDKEDFISEAKTERLIDLFIYMTKISDSTINTEPFINASYLDIILNNSKDLKK